MQLLVLNGSPRGKRSNTSVLLEDFLKGFIETEGNSYEVEYLVQTKDRQKLAERFKDSTHVILAFPLYVDAMPGIVKFFIESLRPLRGRQDNPTIGFMVQGGFPEALHSRFVERYLRKLAKRLNCPYAGCLVKGGFEATSSMPKFMTKRVFHRIHELGKTYGKTGKFDSELVDRLARPEHLSVFRRTFFRIALSLGLAHGYWNRELKANSAFEKRFDMPFA